MSRQRLTLSKQHSTLLPTATMSNELFVKFRFLTKSKQIEHVQFVSTLSKGRNFVPRCYQKRKQCRRNIRLCRKNRWTCSIRQRCFDFVAGVNGALQTILLAAKLSFLSLSIVTKNDEYAWVVSDQDESDGWGGALTGSICNMQEHRRQEVQYTDSIIWTHWCRRRRLVCRCRPKQTDWCCAAVGESACLVRCAYFSLHSRSTPTVSYFWQVLTSLDWLLLRSLISQRKREISAFNVIMFFFS